MPEIGGVLELINRIYDAAFNPDLWDQFLLGYANALRCDGAGIHFEERNHPSATVGTTVQFHPKYVRQYEQYYASKKVWIRTGAPSKIGELRLSQEHYPERELMKTEYYNDWLRPQNLFYGIGPTIGRQKGSPAHISAFRSKASGPFDDADSDLTRILIPHLERAFQLHSRMAELEMHKTASADALDRLAVGIIFLNTSAEIVYFNRAAKAVLDQKDGLGILHSKLVSADQAESSQIRKSTADAIAVFEGDGLRLSAGEALSISRPSGRRKFSLIAVSLPREGSRIRHLLAPDCPAVTIIVSDPESEDSSSSGNRILRGFGLTEAKGKVAFLLMQGKGPEECAAEFGTSIHTSRNHIKRIMSKTGAKRQAELVYLLMKTVSQFKV